MAEFVMPILTADMAAGTLVAWRKQVGDPVKRGDVVATVETDKGVIDVEIFTSGVIEKIVVQPGERVPTGTVLAIIRDAAPAERAPAVAAGAPAVGTVPPGAPSRVRVSPLAKKIAEQLGVDLATVRGTGPGATINREDVERAAAPVAPAGIADARARIRQTIAAAMARSKREIPHYYLSTTIDMQRATEWLRGENLKRPVTDRLLPAVLLIKAVALAVRDVPELNGHWVGDHAVPSAAVHVGFAISLRGGGLIAPALHDADRQSLDELMRSLRDLVQRTRSGGLRSSELSDPTITITSLGDQGVDTVFGIVHPPQVALVGFGKQVERPWCVDGQVVSRPVLTVTLSADHRVSDGHRGGLFLAAVDRRLQEPHAL